VEVIAMFPSLSPRTPRRRPPAARVRATLLVGGLLVAGCGTSAPAGPTDPAPERRPVAAITELSPADAPAVAEAVNTFGFDLFGEAATGDGNAVASPLSAAVLLAMVLAGAGGDTAEAMARVLHLDDPRDVRVAALLAALTDTEDVTLSVDNAAWADDDVGFRPEYLEFARDTFGATVDTADLARPAIVDTVDGWVSEHTEGRIETIATDLGLPDPRAALVLLNAVYFLGTWTTRFDPADTVERPFTLADGQRVDVPLMHLRGQSLGYAERDGYRMLRLPYGETGRYGMEILLPEPDTGLAGLLDRLDAAEWRAAVDGLTERTVDELALPRFTLRWRAGLNDPLTRLGMGPAFDPATADFSPMSPEPLVLTTVVQKTFIQVDEAGTEAAAVTGGAVGITSARPPLTFRVDRPFAFTISDTETGAILFLGAVADPRGDG
jgi:serpin B